MRLASCPEDRFASCLDFVRALQQDRHVAAVTKQSDTDPDLVTTPRPQSKPTVPMSRPAPASVAVRPVPTIPAGLLEGYRFLECASNSALMEVWKVQDAKGKKKLVQLLYGVSSSEKQLKEAVQRLRSVHHPALFTPELAQVDKGRLLFLTDSCRETARDRFRQCQARKQPGIARGELIDYLRAAAEVLDYLYQQHGVQHLNLSPRNLILDNGWLQIAEFGYAQLLWLPEGQDVAKRDATRYAAPELFGKDRPRGCDQYSLALIYAEMLTGVHPFGGQSPEVYAARRTLPELARMPELDREVITRALHPNPAERWSSCTEMLLALEGTSPELNQMLLDRPDSFATLLENCRGSKKSSVYTGISPTALNQVIAEIINSAGGNIGVPAMPPTLDGDDAGTLVHTFQAGLPLGTARGKLEEYGRELGVRVCRQDDNGCVLHLQLSASFWQQWLGREPALEIDVRLARVNPMSATPIEVTARVRALRCSVKQGRDLLEKTGTDLIDALQKHMLVNSEKRVQDRLLWPHAVTVIPLQPGGARDEPMGGICRGKDAFRRRASGSTCRTS